METKKTNRIAYFDIAKGIGILLVLLGHLQTDTIFSYSPYILKLCSWIFSFHMPLFFIISGMLISCKKEPEKDLSNLIRKKYRSIIIPYFWFSLIYIMIVIYSLLITKVVPLKTLFIQLWYVIGMYGMNVLWFLPALFFGEMLFLFITQHFKGIKFHVSIIVLLIVAITGNNGRALLPHDPEYYVRLDELVTTLLRPLFACVYIYTGFYIYRGLDLLEKKFYRSRIIEGVLMPLLLINNIFLNMINRPVDFRSLVFNDYFVYYLCSVSGSLFIILLSRCLSSIHIGEKINKDTLFPILKFYGVNSLVFMGVHNNSAILNLAERCAMYLNQYLTRARGYICYAVVVMVFLIYITLTILVINRFFPFITGRSFREK